MAGGNVVSGQGGATQQLKVDQGVLVNLLRHGQSRENFVALAVSTDIQPLGSTKATKVCRRGLPWPATPYSRFVWDRPAHKDTRYLNIDLRLDDAAKLAAEAALQGICIVTSAEHNCYSQSVKIHLYIYSSKKGFLSDENQPAITPLNRLYNQLAPPWKVTSSFPMLALHEAVATVGSCVALTPCWCETKPK